MHTPGNTLCARCGSVREAYQHITAPWSPNPGHEFSPTRHTDWCPKAATGHDGDCWEADARARGVVPGSEPAMVIVEVGPDGKEIRREEIR